MAVHWNNHLMCAVDVETTGLDADKHEIWQIAIVPLKSDLTIRKDIPPFYMDLQPQKPPETFEPQAIRMNKEKVLKAIERGIDPYKAADYFDDWFQKLNLPMYKKILPLAHNWPFENRFLHAWLGSFNMDQFFFGYRDTMVLANVINDIADMRNEPWPFAKVSLGYMCSTLKIENLDPHDALGDAVACAEVYRTLVRRYRLV